MTKDYLNKTISHNIFRVIKSDGVICYPTESVWGLGCHPRSLKAFERILKIKQRPYKKGVILVAATISQIIPYAQIPDTMRTQVEHAWNNFSSCILPKADNCPNYLCGSHQSIAVRLTNYNVLKELCLAAGSALVSTSANLNGQAVVADIIAAQNLFKDNVDYYVDAPLGGAKKPSRIIDFTQSSLVTIRD